MRLLVALVRVFPRVRPFLYRRLPVGLSFRLWRRLRQEELDPWLREPEDLYH